MRSCFDPRLTVQDEAGCESGGYAHTLRHCRVAVRYSILYQINVATLLSCESTCTYNMSM